MRRINEVIMTAVIASAACTTGNSGTSTSSGPVSDPSIASAAPAANGGASAAKVGTLALELSVTGTTARVTLRNTGSTPLAVVTRVIAGESHYDWLSVVVDEPGGARTLRFTDDRNRSGTEIIELAAGASWSDELDLAAWARRAVNGARPLPSGDVTLRAIYEVSGRSDVWIGKIESPAVTARF